MLARLPWSPAPKEKRKPVKRLNKDRRRHLVESVATIMREAHNQGAPSKFTFEASCRHGLRSGLCLQGWNWHEANMVAVEIVGAALNQIGALRPTWRQGQPEWTQDGALPIERERCIRCRKPLPEGHRKFCSHVCNTAYNGARRQKEKREEIYAAWKANRAAWSAKQPERACACCGKLFRPRKPQQRFCGHACVRDIYLRHPR